MTTKRKTTLKRKPHSAAVKRSRKRISKGWFVVIVALVAGVGYFAVSVGHADSCTVSSTLVNSCRPWLGAAVSGYPQVASDIKSQVLYHETRIGHQLDLVHIYNGVGDDTLSTDAVYFATRANTYLYQNWKGPTANWGDVANYDSGIDSMANSIKSLGSKKIFLTYWHEPENDVSPGGDPNCPNLTYKGSSGTVAQYKAAWAYIENRFDSDGVTNVVWVMNYMGYAAWDCLIPDMWPGNSLVDWVTWDSYSSGDSSTWDNTVGRVYDLLESDNSTTDNFESKPWGAAEWGDCDTADQAHVYQYYGEAKAALDAGTYPRLKMYMIYDDSGNNAGMGCLTEYSKAGVYDPTEQADYNAFADDSIFTSTSVNTPTPTPTPTPRPTVTPTPTPVQTSTPAPTITPKPSTEASASPSPSPPVVILTPGSGGGQPTVSGTVTLAPSNLPPGATSVHYFVDGKAVQSATINTNDLSNGKHTIETKITTASGKTILQKSTIEVHNHKSLGQDLVAAFTGDPAETWGVVVVVIVGFSAAGLMSWRFGMLIRVRNWYIRRKSW
ncbi:MAG TPA: hypothetical protein VMS08_00250 [Candidatus Saccharimonadia bacterium]|nr:hypothetical protein [Candidatus Saccharimonadia bacterium]